MKRPTLLFLFFFLTTPTVFSQTWAPMGSGLNQTTNSFAEYQNEFYAGGYYSYPRRIAKWDGSSWANVGQGILVNSPYVIVQCLKIFNGELIVGGSFDTVGTLPILNLAKWNGSSWSSVGTGLTTTPNSGIFSMTIYNGDLYVGGAIETVGSTHLYGGGIAKWDGSNWTPLARVFGEIYSMTVFNGALYVGGKFFAIYGADTVYTNNIAKWDGAHWTGLGNGVINPPGWGATGIYSMETFNEELYAGGFFDTAGTIHARNIARWDGLNWDSVGTGITTFGQTIVYALKSHNGILYAGGDFDSVAGMSIKGIAKWNGNTWSDVQGSLTSSGAVMAIEINNNVLYAGGVFNSIGSISANNVAFLTLPCSAYFTMSPDTIPHNWIAFNQAAGVPPLTYSWDWGDGNSSTGATPSHTYSTPGFYPICLSITDGIGCTSTYCDSSTYLFRPNSEESVITVNVTNSITGLSNTVSNQTALKIYPVPSKGNLTIDNVLTPTIITLYDMMGNILIRNLKISKKSDLDLSKFCKGMYILRADQNNKQFLQKIIID